MKRLYDARPSNIRPFMDRMKLHISELDLPNVRIQQRNLFLFQPWNTPRFHYINPFATYSKSTVAPLVFQRVFAYHRSQYSRYSAIYTDGSKRADYVGCGVVIEDIMHGYRLDTSCSIFTAEAVAIYRALQLIDSTMPRKYCIYTDSMSVLEALENYHDRCHPVESWSKQLDNKLHSVKPVIGAWPVMPMRRTDVKLTRLRIGHTRFTHRHLLFGERAPECPSCHVSYTVHHILIDCPVFNTHRMTFFHQSVLTLSDLVLSNTLWGADRVSLLRVYQALILSRLDYGCVVYGSARASVLKRLDTVYHSALRICSLSGAFRTSPVTSLYVVCHQPPLELRWRQLCANYFIRAMSVPSHPLKPFALAIGLNRLYEARSFIIKPFSERAKAVLNDAHLNNINIQENNILAFPPWDIQNFNYHNPFSGYDKAGTAAVIYQQLFSFHRSKYSKYIPVYADGSKTAGHVGCGVVYNNTILSFSLHNSMSVFSAELTAILVALQHIIVSNHRHFCVFTDSMSALESLHFSTEHRHPTVIEILLLLRKLERKGFHIIFSWVPGHVGILGNEQADTAARSMSDHMQRSVCYRDLKTSTQNYIHRVWQETWDQQILNKLHSIHPSTSHWAALPVRRHDVRLTRLRIGHTRFTHRHLLVAVVAEWYRYRTVACFVTGSSPVPLKTRRVGQRCTLNLSRAETSSRWCGVVVRRGGCQLRCRPRHLTMVQNYVVRRQKPSCS
ncbi:putative RNA-directed DNA polymerase from transposon X-element [Trichonephila clavipes]|nr:putative RNA-directed DNA polymerase from transposon X-element [Trichonephila clavipes]